MRIRGAADNVGAMGKVRTFPGVWAWVGAAAPLLAQPCPLAVVDNGTVGGQDFFGYDVALSDVLAVVGAPGDSGAAEHAGAVHLFDLSDVAAPVPLGRWWPGGTVARDSVGTSLDLAGDLLVVGAAGVGDDDEGAVYLVDVSDPENPSVVATVAPGDLTRLSRFGHGVAIAGDLLAVGAPTAQHAGYIHGAVYLYDVSNPAQPIFLSRIVTDQARSRPTDLHLRAGWFGLELDFDDGLLAVGAPLEGYRDSSSGAVYLFDVSNPASPVQLAYLRRPQGAPDELMGMGVVLTDARLCVGVPGRDWVGATDVGQVMIYDVADPSAPNLISSLGPAGYPDNANFGLGLGGADGWLGVGAPGAGDAGPGAGAVHLYDIRDGVRFIMRIATPESSGNRRFGRRVAFCDDLLLTSASAGLASPGLAGAAKLGLRNDCPADLNLDGRLDYFDIARFLDAFDADCWEADFFGDGTRDFNDVSRFIQAMQEPCPLR